MKARTMGIPEPADSFPPEVEASLRAVERIRSDPEFMDFLRGQMREVDMRRHPSSPA
jgi:hypothetical protein